MLNKGLSAAHQGKRERRHFSRLFTSVNSAAYFIKDCVTSFAESNSIFTDFP